MKWGAQKIPNQALIVSVIGVWVYYNQPGPAIGAVFEVRQLENCPEMKTMDWNKGGKEKKKKKKRQTDFENGKKGA